MVTIHLYITVNMPSALTGSKCSDSLQNLLYTNGKLLVLPPSRPLSVAGVVALHAFPKGRHGGSPASFLFGYALSLSSDASNAGLGALSQYQPKDSAPSRIYI